MPLLASFVTVYSGASYCTADADTICRVVYRSRYNWDDTASNHSYREFWL